MRISNLIIFTFVIIPFFYATAQILNLKLLYGVKDVLFLTITILLLFSSYNKNILFAIAFVTYLNLYGLMLSNNSLSLFGISVREFWFYPFFGVLTGAYVSKHKGLMFAYKFLGAYVVFTLLFSLLFVDISYGPTNRLKSFWDREHEPGIIAAILIIITLYNTTGLKKPIMICVCISLILLSGSRSAIVAVLFAIFVVELKQLNFIRVLVLSAIALLSVLLFETLTVSGRSIDHNLIARILQYQLAWDAIIETQFLGLGPDKYGVLGDYVVEYCINGRCTTTMDSTIIKYLVNYGVGFALFALWLIYRVIIFAKRPSENYEKKSLIGIFVACLIFGLVTGKLGAFPLNTIFYITVGIILQLGRNNYERQINNENNICCKLTKAHRPNPTAT